MPIGHFGDVVEDQEALELAQRIIAMHEAGEPLAKIVQVVSLALAQAEQKEA